jgi:hypothetical protein
MQTSGYEASQFPRGGGVAVGGGLTIGSGADAEHADQRPDPALDARELAVRYAARRENAGRVSNTVARPCWSRWRPTSVPFSSET